MTRKRSGQVGPAWKLAKNLAFLGGPTWPNLEPQKRPYVGPKRNRSAATRSTGGETNRSKRSETAQPKEIRHEP